MCSNYEDIIKSWGGLEKYREMVHFEGTRFEILSSVLTPAQKQTLDVDQQLSQTLKQDVECQRLLLEAIELHSFENVTKHIGQLFSVPNPIQRVSSAQGQESGLSISFRKQYIGTAVDGLYDYITHCNELFLRSNRITINPVMKTRGYYGRFIPVVQSSGTGKTRTIVELMKRNVLGLYINVRSWKHVNTYPPNDRVPRKILTGSLNCPAQEYTRRCTAFFTSIFIVLRNKLQLLKSYGNNTPEALRTAWSKDMCTMESAARRLFFEEVKEVFEQLTNIKFKSLRSDDSSDDSSDDEKNHTRPLHSKSGQELAVMKQRELPGGPQMIHAYIELMSSFPAFFASSDCPKLVIAIDAAQQLSKPRVNFRPLNILCRVINQFSYQSEVSNWVIFASTTAEIAEFSAPVFFHPSHRISRGGEVLFPPYSQFGWDQMAQPLGTFEPEHTGKLGNIIGYGRPLWSTLTDSSTSLNEILETARVKLCNSHYVNVNKLEHVLAVFGQRFCLDVCFGHPSAVHLQTDSVEAHLRICLNTTTDGIWKTTVYPSEPLLSSAAAIFTHPENNFGDSLAYALDCLKRGILGGVVDIGKNGELVSRLLFLLGKDFCIRSPGLLPAFNQPKQAEKWQDQEVIDCKPLSVIHYLRFLFGESQVTKDMEDMFEGWHVNFSHWISMEKPIKFLESGVQPMEKWLTRLWYRSCAIQCDHNQPAIDKLIPMFKLDPTPKLEPSDNLKQRISYILISDHVIQGPTQSQLDTITPSNAEIPELGVPYIAIHADLRVKNKAPTFTLSDNPQSAPRLWIHAPGTTPETYHFLSKRSSRVPETLQEILDAPLGPAEPIASVASLRDQLQFGATTEERHTEWERGRREAKQ